MDEVIGVGDVVQLLAGPYTPYMKVIAVDGDRVTVTWCDVTAKQEQITFERDLLRKISGPTGMRR
jgi:hypothetical protein